VLVLICGVGTYFGTVATIPSPSRPTKPSQASLVVSPSSLNFGEVWESGHFNSQIEFENRGNRSINITHLQSSCQCLAIDPQAIIVPSGESRRVSIAINLLAKRPSGQAEDWDVQLPLIAKWDEGGDGPEQSEWLIHGKVKSIVSVSPGILDFGDQLVLGNQAPPIKAVIRVKKPGTRVNIKTTPEGFSVALEKSPQDYTIIVTPPRSLPVGAFDQIIGMELSSEHDGTTLPESRIRVRGEVSHRVVAVPPIIHLGLLKVGTTAVGTTTIRSRTGRSFDISKLLTSPDGSQVDVTKSADGYGISIRQKVESPGTGSATMTLLAKVSDGEIIPVDIAWDWYGIPVADQ
jgi:hypothetical protein